MDDSENITSATIPHEYIETTGEYFTCYGRITHSRHFFDDSSLIYYDSGLIGSCCNPPSLLAAEPFKVPDAVLYLWQIELRRPDITTWEQIRQAEREDNEKTIKEGVRIDE
jgi:hypothetical protein